MKIEWDTRKAKANFKKHGVSSEEAATALSDPMAAPKSPFDIPGIKTKATTEDILEAIKDSRERRAEHGAAEDS